MVSTAEYRASLGRFLKSRGNTVENETQVEDMLLANITRGFIFGFNHFGLFDGPMGMAMIGQLRGIRDLHITIPVKKDLIRGTQILNKVLKLDAELMSVTTPHMAETNPAYNDACKEGFMPYISAARKNLNAQDNKGAVLTWVEASRKKYGMECHPGEKDKVMESLLRGVEKSDPLICPVAMWSEGIPKILQSIPPGILLRWFNPFPYHFRFGTPISYSGLRSRYDRKFTGAEDEIWQAIRANLPDNYLKK